MKEMCFEKRAFYRVVSGLHASIAVHLTSRYPQGEGSWGRNLEEFLRRFQPSTTAGEGPARLANLYFLYLLELRALSKASAYLAAQRYYTGETEEDIDTQVQGNLRQYTHPRLQ